MYNSITVVYELQWAHICALRLIDVKVAKVIPWNQVCVDLIGQYTIKAGDKTTMDFMCFTVIDPVTSCLV